MMKEVLAVLWNLSRTTEDPVVSYRCCSCHWCCCCNVVDIRSHICTITRP